MWGIGNKTRIAHTIHSRKMTIQPRSNPSVVGLVVTGTVGLAAYLGTVWLVDSDRLRDFARLVRRTS